MELKEKILEFIRNDLYTPVKAGVLFELVCNENEGYPEFQAALTALTDSSLVTFTKKNKVIASEEMGYIRGVFRASAKGFGFVIPDAEYAKRAGGDIFIPPTQTLDAINGDIVMAALGSTDKRHGGKPSGRDSGKSSEGKIVRVLEHSVKNVIGKLCRRSQRGKNIRSFYYVAPDNDKLNFDIKIDADSLLGAAPDDKVEVEITKYPSETEFAKGTITKVFGDNESKEANYEAILHEHGIPLQFEYETLELAKTVSAEPTSPEGRLDLRERIVFTIDGADAKDLDDAISIEKTENGYILGVHIADVSHYVHKNSPLDREAFERGTSVYFVDKVVPMLPPALSNGCCSLNGGVDRYALSAIITLDNEGHIQNCDVKKTIINSKVRGVYSEINDVIEKGASSDFYGKYSVLFPDTLPTMLELYETLEKNSVKRGALELETVEAAILLDATGHPCDIVKRERGIGERLIEQFMLCANEAVANWLFWQNMPCVYRIHENPSPEKVSVFTIFAHNLGLDTSPLKAKNLHPTAFQSVLRQAKEKGTGTTVSYVLLRSLMKARYSSESSPHFGLGIDKYCHFTSPIRRYPDLTVHRIISAVLAGDISLAAVEALSELADKSAVASSENELRAVYAERDIEDLYKAVYMSDRIGCEFDGVVSSVMQFGFFVELDNTCEGLVPVSSLKGYYEYDERSMSLVCGLHSIKLGDRVSVSVEGADIVTRRVEMRLLVNVAH